MNDIYGGSIRVAHDTLRLTHAPKVFHLRPSADMLFESMAKGAGNHAVAVVLTGANDDGCRGVRRVRRRGGTVLVQTPETSERPEMPEAAIATGVVDEVLPLDAIAPRLMDFVS